MDESEESPLLTNVHSSASTTTTNSDPVAVLPSELVMAIFEQLSTADLLSVARVSKRWMRASEDHILWRAKCLRELTPAIPAAEIVVENRDYKQFFKTEWLISKWKQSHKPRRPLTSAARQAKEEYRQLNFQFEEKLLDLREMVSYRAVVLLRLFNSPLIDYATLLLWLLVVVGVGLRLDGVLARWKWSAALAAVWPLALTFLGSTLTTWYFFFRGFLAPDFMQRALFGWINVLSCCFCDDVAEASLWCASAVSMVLSTATLGMYLDGLLPHTWPGSPWIAMAPAALASLLLAVLFVRSAAIKPGAVRGIKAGLALACFVIGAFFLLLAAWLQGGLLPKSWGVWELSSPLWVVDGLGFVGALTLCDPLFFTRDRWFKNGLTVLCLVLIVMSPFLTCEVLLCLRIAGNPHVKYFSFALIPLAALVCISIIVVVVADLHLWQRIKHFWVVKRSFRWPLREHWRSSTNTLLVFD